MGIICPVLVVINMTPIWTKFDQFTLDRAVNRCGQLYQDAPCLKKFVKKKELTYTAVCVKKHL